MATVHKSFRVRQMIKVRISQSKGHLHGIYNMRLASASVYNYSLVTDSNFMASFVQNIGVNLKTGKLARVSGLKYYLKITKVK